MLLHSVYSYVIVEHCDTLCNIIDSMYIHSIHSSDYLLHTTSRITGEKKGVCTTYPHTCQIRSLI